MENSNKKEIVAMIASGVFVSVIILAAIYAPSFGGGSSNQKSQTISSKVVTVTEPTTVKTATIGTTGTTLKQSTTDISTLRAAPTTEKTECNDGIDNDKDGAVDKVDYSCVNGTAESFDKTFGYQAAITTWPTVPEFDNRAQCRSFCSDVLWICRSTPTTQKNAMIAQCLSLNNCRLAGTNACQDTVGCRRIDCTDCVRRANSMYDPKLEKCDAQFRACNAECDRRYPTGYPTNIPSRTVN